MRVYKTRDETITKWEKGGGRGEKALKERANRVIYIRLVILITDSISEISTSSCIPFYVAGKYLVPDTYTKLSK